MLTVEGFERLRQHVEMLRTGNAHMIASDIEVLMRFAKSAASWHDGIERGFCYPLAPGQARRGRTHNRRWDAKKVVKAILAGLPFSPTM